MHRLANNVFRTIIGYVDAFFATIEPDSYEWNGDRKMLFLALVDRAEVVVWTDLFECGDSRSGLCCRNHHRLKPTFFNQILQPSISSRRMHLALVSEMNRS